VTDRDALLASVLADPSDDTARLVLADFLRESDDPDEQARGRFLWAGVTASRFRGHDLIDDPFYYAAQREIAAVAGAGRPARWLSALGLGPQPAAPRDWAWDCTLDRVTVRAGTAAGTFARGLLAELSVSFGEWNAVAAAVLDSWPLERVAVADAPGFCFVIDRPGGGWRLTARLKVPGRRIPLAGGLIPTAVSPLATLALTPADWWAEELFPERAALVGEIRPACARLADDLRGAAGDRWPSPPRRRG
jgi:uncharacterized protein (TIGR02996 family)